jgi:hypothetical protein
MAVLVSPFGPKPQFELSDGTPAVGNRLFFYVAGSVGTKQNTYTDSAGGSANTNPLVLNALGMPTTEIWWTAGLTYKVVYAPPGSDDPPNSPIWTVDNLSAINDVTGSFDEWKAGPTPTFVSATSFTLVGDQTATFTKSRRVKTTNTGGTVYSTIVSSAFGAVTTVTVANDSGTLDAGLSAVSYSLISAANPSIDADMVTRKGTAVTAAATTDIWSIAGNYVHVTGATGITSFGTAPYAGARRLVVFDSTPTVTYNATTLITPGQTSFTAQAGSIASVVADTTANMRVEWVWQALSAAAKLPRSNLAGFGMVNNAGDAVNDIDFAVGECRDSTNAADMIALTAMTKQLDAAWAAGSAAGGRMSAAAIANTSYFCYVIRKDSDGTCDFGFDTSATAPTMPGGYTYFRRIGAILRLAGSILAFIQDGDYFRLSIPILDVSAANPGTAAVTRTLSVPVGISVWAAIDCGLRNATPISTVAYLSDLAVSDQAASATVAPLGTFGDNVLTQVDLFSNANIRTNTSAQIRSRLSGSDANVTLYIATLGWQDRRGRDA